MSIISYRQSITLAYDDPSFYAYIMAAMRKADDHNLALLESVFPDVLEELRARYNAPGGCLNERELTWLTHVLEGASAVYTYNADEQESD
jgi:hypothetical protein